MRYKVSVQRAPMRTIVDLKNSESQLNPVLSSLGYSGPIPSVKNTYVINNDYVVCWIGPEHWWIQAPIEREKEISALLEKHTSHQESSAILLSDSMVFFTVSGEAAADVLSVASPLDVQSVERQQCYVSWTDCFGLRALVLCNGNSEYELGIDNSFAPMFAACLGKAVGSDLTHLGNPVYAVPANPDRIHSSNV